VLTEHKFRNHFSLSFCVGHFFSIFKYDKNLLFQIQIDFTTYRVTLYAALMSQNSIKLAVK